MDYREVQRIAKQTIAMIRAEIRPGMQLSQVREMCERHMRMLGMEATKRERQDFAVLTLPFFRSSHRVARR